MQTATLIRLLGNVVAADDPNNADAFGPMPELPSLSRRWTVRRKAAVIEAVRGGWVPTGIGRAVQVAQDRAGSTEPRPAWPSVR
jgi:hypothetical protein